MSNLEINLLKDSLCDEESGLTSLFEQWQSSGDYTYDLRIDTKDNLLIVLTEVATNRIEVFALDIRQVI